SIFFTINRYNLHLISFLDYFVIPSGCDLNIEYNNWAIQRLANVRRMTKEEWIAFDRKNAERRESIR
ncbi:hypothetical protein MEN24_10430, partial [Dolichospermum sp. ST_sed10]|nr:hypothetical protein [Dolichospermum sp. ST_sed9]MDD1436800.1 hypothetical protein [Dolichospermum sp. ST_sed10]